MEDTRVHRSLYTESAITSDFDKLSLLSSDTPKEHISGYSLTPSSPKKYPSTDVPNFVKSAALSPYNSAVSRTSQRSPAALTSLSPCQGAVSRTSQRSPATLGNGRGKNPTPATAMPSQNLLNRCYMDGELEQQIRLAVPLGFSNDLIEHHYAHHLKDKPPQSLALPSAKFSTKNVALTSLSKSAKKAFSTNSGFVLDNKDFPSLK